MMDTEPPPGGSSVIVIVTSTAFLSEELWSHPLIHWVTLHQLHLSLTADANFLSSLAQIGLKRAVIAFPRQLLTTKKFTAITIYLKKLGMVPEIFPGNEKQLYNWVARLPKENIGMSTVHEVVVYAGSVAHHEGLLKLQQDERVRNRILWRGGSDLNKPVPEGIKKVFFFTELGGSQTISNQAGAKGFQFFEKRRLEDIEASLKLYFQPVLQPVPAPLPGPAPTPTPTSGAKNSPWLVTTEEQLPTHISGTKEQTWSVLGINPAARKETLKEQLGEQGVDERINLYIPAETIKATQKQGHGNDDPLENVPMVILLSQVSEPIRSTTQHLLTQRGILCIAIPKWGFNELRSWLGTCTFNWTADTFRFCVGGQWYPVENRAATIKDTKEAEEQHKTSKGSNMTLELNKADDPGQKSGDQTASPTPLFTWEPNMNCKRFTIANFNLATTIAAQVRSGEVGWESTILTEAGRILGFKPASMYGAVNTYIHETNKPQHTRMRRADGKLKDEFLTLIQKHMPRNALLAVHNGNNTSSKTTIPVFANGVPAAAELLSPVLTAMENFQRTVAELVQKVVILEGNCKEAQLKNEQLAAENTRLQEESAQVMARNQDLEEIQQLVRRVTESHITKPKTA